MSKILGIWGEVPKEGCEWHENRHIPESTKRLGARAFYFEAGENAFEEEQKQDATSLTLYEGLESTDPRSAIDQSLPLAGPSKDVPQDALLEARAYTCQMANQVKDFSGDYADAGCLVLGNFEPSRATHDEFFRWWYGEFVPMIQSSPDFLRVRLWKLDDAADLRVGSVRRREPDDLLRYIMAYEFSSDDIPWELMVQIGQSEGWQRFVEQDLQYKYGLYHLKRIYTQTGEVEAEFDNNSAYSDDEE